MSEPKPLSDTAIEALHTLAAVAAMEPGRTIARAVPGRMEVCTFIDGKHHETLVIDAGGRARATMLAFDAVDLSAVLDSHAYYRGDRDRALVQRDAARRVACGSEDAEGLQEQARRANLRGWGYLYPEKSEKLPVFPDIDCAGDCGFERRGVGWQCVDVSACGRYVHPGDEHYDALTAYDRAMSSKVEAP